MSERTVLRSRSGKKLYAVRSANGQFKDIQSYQKAHSKDIKLKSRDERIEKTIKLLEVIMYKYNIKKLSLSIEKGDKNFKYHLIKKFD